MPRYYFHLRTGQRDVVDPEGDDLRDLSEAWGIAHGLAHRLSAAFEGGQRDACWVEVADETADVLLRVPLQADPAFDRALA